MWASMPTLSRRSAMARAVPSAIWRRTSSPVSEKTRVRCPALSTASGWPCGSRARSGAGLPRKATAAVEVAPRRRWRRSRRTRRGAVEPGTHHLGPGDLPARAGAAAVAGRENDQTYCAVEGRPPPGSRTRAGTSTCSSVTTTGAGVRAWLRHGGSGLNRVRHLTSSLPTRTTTLRNGSARATARGVLLGDPPQGQQHRLEQQRADHGVLGRRGAVGLRDRARPRARRSGRRPRRRCRAARRRAGARARSATPGRRPGPRGAGCPRRAPSRAGPAGPRRGGARASLRVTGRPAASRRVWALPMASCQESVGVVDGGQHLSYVLEAHARRPRSARGPAAAADVGLVVARPRGAHRLPGVQQAARAGST